MDYGEPSWAGKQRSEVQPAGCLDWEVSFSDTVALETLDITSTTGNSENVFCFTPLIICSPVTNSPTRLG
jgi:hypothetical protein